MRKVLVAATLLAAFALIARARTPQSDSWLSVQAKGVQSSEPNAYQFRGVTLYLGAKDAVLVADEADFNSRARDMELRGDVKISAVALKSATVAGTRVESGSGAIHIKDAQFKTQTFVLSADEAQGASANEDINLMGRVRMRLLRSLEGDYPDVGEAAHVARVMHLRKGATIADIGAGNAYFTVALAKQVGDDVRVVATDVKSQLLPLVKGLQDGGWPRNLTVGQGSDTETNLPDGSCDALIVRRTYHHLFQPAAMTQSFLRTLRRGGRLLVIESPLVRLNPVPPDTPAFREGDGIMASVLIKELSDAGFLHEQTIQDINDARRLYLVVMRKR